MSKSSSYSHWRGTLRRARPSGGAFDVDDAANPNASVPELGESQISLPCRRHPAHPPVHENLDEPTLVFLTVFTAARKPILACQDAAELLLKCWSDKPAWIVGQYVIMPDHVHLFCAPAAFPCRPSNGYATGSRALHAPGRDQANSRFGSAIVGTPSFAAETRTQPSGSTSWQIQSAQGWPGARRTGRTRANSAPCVGKIHLRGTLRRARPSGGPFGLWANETLNPRGRPTQRAGTTERAPPTRLHQRQTASPRLPACGFFRQVSACPAFQRP
jgi:hypothetical protein